MTIITLPSPHEPFVDLETGKVSEVWYRYLTQSQIATNDATTVELTATAPLSISTAHVISISASTLGFAGQAEEEAGTSSTAVVTPSVQQYHLSAVKAWGIVGVTSSDVVSLTTGYNVSGISGNSSALTVGLTVPFATSDYAVNVSILQQSSDAKAQPFYRAKATTGFQILSQDSSGSYHVPAEYSFTCYGDQ